MSHRRTVASAGPSRSGTARPATRWRRAVPRGRRCRACCRHRSAGRTPRGLRQARPMAPRAVEASWEVTAATPVKATPTAATAAPAVKDPAAGWPFTSMARPSSTASTRFAASVTSDRRGQSGVPAHHGRAEHLRPAELLVLPGVAHHRERAHHGGQHRQGDVVADHRGPTDAGAGREAEHAQAGVVGRELASPPRRRRRSRASRRTWPWSRPGRRSGRASRPAGSTRSRRSASRASGRVPVSPVIGPAPPRPRRRGRDDVSVVPQEQLLERGRRAGQRADVEVDQMRAAPG